ncbi:MAG: methionine synthase [Sporichthyaceae bacterium]|nr:methionine synthase [Sporichthyaceae bacterium]
MVHTLPWPPGSATGIGSLPGTDPTEAVRIVFGELSEFPHLPELPARGPGAELVGRGAALLVDFPVELTSTGWAVTGRPGRDIRRSRSYLADDLDLLEEHGIGRQGPVKIQAAGPWTLAASIELRNGEKLLADSGAYDDLVASLAEGLAGHVAEVQGRLPEATVVVQLDEPSLPAVLAGTVPSASHLRMLPAVQPADAVIALGAVRAAMPAPATVVAHCCAPGAPVGLLHRAAMDAIAFDFGLLPSMSEDEMGAAIEAGLGVFAGIVSAVDGDLSALADTVDPVRQWWRRLGFAPERLAEQVVVTPACGLAGASPGYARRAMTHCREAARVLLEAPEG